MVSGPWPRAFHSLELGQPAHIRHQSLHGGCRRGVQERYVNELPRSFNPKAFDPREWARVARLAGFRYVVFTASTTPVSAC